MTARYELNKLYRANQDIKVTEASLKEFKAGLREDLEHLVVYHSQEVKVTCKPKILNYQNYIPIYILPQKKIR